METNANLAIRQQQQLQKMHSSLLKLYTVLGLNMMTESKFNKKLSFSRILKIAIALSICTFCIYLSVFTTYDLLFTSSEPVAVFVNGILIYSNLIMVLLIYIGNYFLAKQYADPLMAKIISMNAKMEHLKFNSLSEIKRKYDTLIFAILSVNVLFILLAFVTSGAKSYLNFVYYFICTVMRSLIFIIFVGHEYEYSSRYKYLNGYLLSDNINFNLVYKIDLDLKEVHKLSFRTVTAFVLIKIWTNYLNVLHNLYYLVNETTNYFTYAIVIFVSFQLCEMIYLIYCAEVTKL